jgi:hypothetical protein
VPKLRNSLWGRVAILAAVLLLAGFVARSQGGGDDALTQDEAVAKAQTVLAQGFEPDGVQVRYLNQGIPPRGTWLVSFYDGELDDPTALQTVLVDAKSGEITDENR